MWEIRLFGKLEARRDGVTVHQFRTRSAAQVLAYLALQIGRPVSRVTVAEAIWPASDRLAGLQSLRTALTSLRSALGDEVIRANRASVWLSDCAATTDLKQLYEGGAHTATLGALLDGLSADWIAPFEAEADEAVVSAVRKRVADLPSGEAEAVVRSQLASSPGNLSLRSMLREFTASPSPRVGVRPSAKPFVGRETEIDEILLLLSQHRLVTLTGPGGIGKSALGREIWRRSQPNSWYVHLAHLDHVDTFMATVRIELGLHQSPFTTAKDHVLSVLRQENGLVVLDNFETVLTAAYELGDILANCPELRVCVTSQVPLGLPMEREYAVRPLGLVAQLPDWTSDAVELFRSRAVAAVPAFRIDSTNRASVSALCDRLEGIPLALEIAAAKSAVYSPEEMVLQLSDRLEFLQSIRTPAEPRHQSLRTALDWSFDRLSTELQDALLGLSVFRGGFTLEAAREVLCLPAADRVIADLLSVAWIHRDEGVIPTRFTMLESLREYCGELIAPSRRAELSRLHAKYFEDRARQCAAQAFTPNEAELHRRVVPDSHNFDLAWDWAVRHDAECALTIAQGLDWYWILKGMAPLGAERMEVAWRNADRTPRRLLGWAAHSMGGYLLFQGKMAESLDWYAAGLRYGVEIEDRCLEGQAHAQIAYVNAELGRHAVAKRHSAAAITSLLGHGEENWIGVAFTIAALVENRVGNAGEAAEFGAESVRRYRKGGYSWGLASALNELARALHLSRAFEQSLEHQRESIELKRSCHAPMSLALSLADQAAALLASGRADTAACSLRESATLLTALNTPTIVPSIFASGSQLLAHLRQAELSATAASVYRELMANKVPCAFERMLTLALDPLPSPGTGLHEEDEHRVIAALAAL